jgi:hypothetical protein
MAVSTAEIGPLGERLSRPLFERMSDSAGRAALGQ